MKDQGPSVAGRLLGRILYRADCKGAENIPSDGGALLVANHVTSIDAELVARSIPRPVSCVADEAEMQKVEGLLKDGHLVCIFPETTPTRNGNIAEFKLDFERIANDVGCPVIPVYIGGAWGSRFSHRVGDPIASLPTKIPCRVTIMYGEAMSSPGAHDVRQAMSELACDWFELLKQGRVSLGRLFVRAARKHWSKPALSDTTGKDLKYGKALIAATLISSILKKICGDQEKIGVVLPATAGAALVNLAITMLGKIPVNLNFTSSADAVADAIEQCQIKTVISSRKFLDKVKEFKAPEGTVCLEDLMPGVTGGQKIKALLRAVFAPCSVLVNDSGFKPDNIATIIFSSGTTGEPKGVMLSHHNIISNMESFGMVFPFTHKDNMCAALPFFHSFGFTCTLWFPLVSGFSVIYHPNPLDGDTIARIVREKKSTILLATPTFLLAYIRRARREDFASVLYTITGAEKLREKIANAFEKKFGIAPLEGYGVTETTPVVSANLPDISDNISSQQGTLKGTIGQPMPGIAARIVDADTDKQLSVGEEGMLMIKGPNVMMGYLNKPETTAEVIRNGWYETGDIAKVDENDFITITDRASRFSKMGGEMVPHIAIEDVFLQAIETEGRVVVVTGVPDERKGERLVVLYVEEAGTAEALQAIIEKSNLPNLWRPRQEDYIKIDDIPVLGSGKLDLKTVKECAATLAV